MTKKTPLGSVVLCLAIAVVFVSCGKADWDDTVITNNSTFPVTFKFNHTGEFTLNPAGSPTNTSKSFETVAHQHLEYLKESKRVSFTYTATNDGATGSFEDLDSIDVEVENPLTVKVILSEKGGWMDDLTVPAGSTLGTISGKIYHLESPVKPEFEVIDENDNPASADWSIDNTNAKPKMVITISQSPWSGQ